jgi:hypothetical protein
VTALAFSPKIGGFDRGDKYRMPTLMRRLAQSSCIPALREGGELRPEAPVVILLGRAFPSVGSSRSPIKILAAVMINRAALATPMIRTGKAGFMSKREAQMILKTDERSIVLELGHEGKFVT